MKTTNPRIGHYYAECCLLDLHQIKTKDDLDDVMERIEQNDENGPLLVYATLDEAIWHLTKDNPLSQEDTERELARLGWAGFTSGH